MFEMFEIVLIFYCLIFPNQALEINDRFSYCKDLNEHIDYEQKCNKSESNIMQRIEFMECEFRNQVLKIRSLNDDSYFKFESNIFHSIYGSIIKTSCQEVNKIEVHEIVERCTKDILVSFELDSKKVFGYLTSDKIIRQKNKLVPCSNEAKHLLVNKIGLVKKKNKIESSKPNKVLIDSLKNADQSVLSFYENNVELNREFRIGYDILLSIVAIINFIYFCWKGKLSIAQILQKNIK
jgi:hypothetical protein